jgi:hypothetical protein
MTSNYWGASLLSTMYKILPNIFMQGELHADKIKGTQSGFLCKRPTTYKVLCIFYILETKIGMQWDSTSVIYRLQQGLQLIQGRRIIQLSHLICYTHETSYDNYDVFTENL